MRQSMVRVWDLPTRIFHWGLLICVAGLFTTAYWPGAPIDWHARFGYGVLTLLAFRLAWGLVGGHWSRFVNVVPSPASLLAYFRGGPERAPRAGHNPLGGLSVLAMLLALALQVGTGLISDDEIAFVGPLNRFVQSATGLAATGWHKDVGQWIVVALIVLHLLAIGYYTLVRRSKLVAAMVHGDKAVDAPTVASRDDLRSRLGALVLLGLCAGGVYLLVAPAA